MAHSFSILSRLRAVRDADLSVALASKGVSMWSAKGVLYTLTTYADEEGVAYPTIATIARTMDASRRTVQRALAALVDAGILSDWQGKDDVSWTVWVVDYARLGALAGAPSRRAPGSVTAQRARRESAPGASWRATNSTGKAPENEPHNTPPEGEGAEPVAAVDRSPSRGEEALVGIGVDRRVARGLVREHTDDRCAGVARIVRGRIDAGHAPRSPAGFAIDCLCKGWEIEVDAETSAALEEREGREAVARLRALDRETLRARYVSYVHRSAGAYPAAVESLLRFDPTDHPKLARKLVDAMDAGEV